MKIYAVFDSAGFLAGLYHVGPKQSAPKGGILLTREAWEDLAVNQAFRRWDGTKIAPYTPPSEQDAG